MTSGEAHITELPASPGARLRREREARGLTPQQAAERLNLDVVVVEALEANDFPSLGAPVFAKGHLRRYAALLELPENDILGGYERSSAQPDLPTLIPRSRVEMAPIRTAPKWPWALAGAAVFLVAAALVAYLSAYGLHLPGGQAAQPAAVVAPPPDAAAETPGQGARSAGAEGVATGVPAAGVAVPGPAGPAQAGGAALPAGQVSLRLQFSADSWVEVYDGTGKAMLYDLGTGGSSRTVTAVAPLSVTVGNAPGVRIAVNGRPVPTPHVPAGQTVARFSVGADGVVR